MEGQMVVFFLEMRLEFISWESGHKQMNELRASNGSRSSFPPPLSHFLLPLKTIFPLPPLPPSLKVPS